MSAMQLPMTPETRALFTTRRWLDSMLALILCFVAAARAVPMWAELTTAEHVSVVVALPLVLAGVWLGSRPGALWLSPAGLLVLAACSLLAPHGSSGWIPMPNTASNAIYICITLVGRRVGLVLVPVAPILVQLIWSTHPTNIVANSMDLLDGWLVTGQVLATSIATWWAWNTLSSEAQIADADYRDREQRADESLAQQERAGVWRAAVSRVHESLLNTIRYVLESTSIDRQRLAAELSHQAQPPNSPRLSGVGTVDALMQLVRMDPVASQVLRTPTRIIDLELTPEVLSATRNALVEVAHNAVTHGKATELRITLAVGEDGVLTIHAIDNGSGLPTAVKPGIGSTLVTVDALTAVGGSVRLLPAAEGGVDAVIQVPLARPGVRRKAYSFGAGDAIFDQGRYLFSLPLAAGAAWGIIYFLVLGPLKSLDRTGGWHFWLATACGITGCVTALVVAARRQHFQLLPGLALTLIPALVPWFLRTSQYTCDNVPNVAAAVNVAGFAMLAICLWTGLLPGAAAVITWVSGAAITLQQVPVTCQSTLKLAMANSTLILPVAVLTSFAAFRSYQRAADRKDELRRREVLEASRAIAADDLNRELFEAVNDATLLVTQVAQGRVLDPRVRHELEVCDARIRAAIQVEPTRSGGMARSVKRIVDTAASLGIPVTVRAMRGSADARPLPPRVEDLLSTAVTHTISMRPTVQVFHDGASEFISVLVDRYGLSAAGLNPSDSLSVDGIDVQVLEEEEEQVSAPHPGCFSVLVSRSTLTNEHPRVTNSNDSFMPTL